MIRWLKEPITYPRWELGLLWAVTVFGAILGSRV
jgi:hypothetical protein